MKGGAGHGAAPAVSDTAGYRGTQALIDEAARAGADCEVWTSRRLVQEIVCRGGAVERRSDVVSGATAVTVWQDGAEGCAVRALPDCEDPSLVRTALAVGRAMPPTGPAPDRPGPVRAPARPQRGGVRLDTPLVDVVRKLSVTPVGLDVELRARAERATVRLHRAGDEARDRVTGLFQLQARVTATSPSGGVGFISDQMYDADADALLDRSARQGLPELCELARVLAEPPAGDVTYDDVLVSGWVMVKLLSLVVPAFQLDTVVERRSPLAELLGRPVCAPGVDLVDDPLAPEYPLAAPWDDEGTPTGPTELVTDGILRGFLSHRHSARTAGAKSSGSGWRGAAGETPRVQPSHLSLRPGADLGPGPRPGRRLLRVVQANGAHTSNGITGDFSIGANAVLEEADGRRRNAGSITVAGNVFELLRNIEGHDGTVRASRSHHSFVTSPGIWTDALTVGH